MGWSHPDMPLEDLLRLIKGFVDILVLASGRLSSGLAASWDAENIKKAIRWGIFFENVLSHLNEADDHEDLVKELDAALFELTSNSYFPQGLRCLSSDTLSRGRDVVLEFFSQNLSLNEGHLNALLNATIEVDIEDITTIDAVGTDLYIDRLIKHVKSLDVALTRSLCMKDCTITTDLSSSDRLNISGHFPTNTAFMKSKQQSVTDHSSLIIENLLKRQASASCLSTCEASLASLLEIVSENNFAGSASDLCDAISLSKEEAIGFLAWDHWRKKSLSYLLNKRTIRLLSGSKLIFDAPKLQWVQIFEPLINSSEAYDDSLLEIIELSLLGLISSRWTCLVDHFVSFAYDMLPVSKQYFSILNLLQETSLSLHSKGKMMSSKENDILDYFTTLLAGQPHIVWNLPPVLVAAALPSWSNLFRSYLNGIESEVKGVPNPIRCCTCNQDGKEHNDCGLAERIWCLYVFHIQGSHLMLDKCGTRP